MKRKIAILLLSALVTSGLAAGTPHIRSKEAKLSDGRTKYERDVYLNSARLILLQHSADGKTATQKKWGDYFFGLEFGRMPRTNGGWSIWDVLKCYEYGKVPTNLLQKFLPENVVVNDINGIAVADLVYPSLNKGKLHIRMMQFPSHPDWLFIRITAQEFQLWRIDFSAHPGNSNIPKDRERHVATGSADYTLAQANVKISPPQSPFFALYNKFIQDNAGNFLIFQPEKFQEVTIPKTSGGVGMRFMVKKGTRQFDFALGQFMNKPSDDTVKRFFAENAEAIRKFMNSIDWNPVLPKDQFEKSCQEALKLGIPEEKLASLRTTHAKAVLAGDSATAAEAVAALEKLKKNTAETGLNQFR